ncbi:MAG TPA: TGS domain-containing protein, partial [Gemmatimonadota bacterium]|nr:TGS domain-containing protein [Gemmatimonadota bacterium]
MSENGTIKIRLPDGSELEANRGATLREIAESIGPRLAKAAYVAEVDGRIVDLSRPL